MSDRHLCKCAWCIGPINGTPCQAEGFPQLFYHLECLADLKAACTRIDATQSLIRKGKLQIFSGGDRSA